MSDRELERRDFLRKAAITGAAAAWAAPIVQTVAASPAFAQTAGTPAAGCCVHGQCVSACQQAGEGCDNSCELTCSDARTPGGGGLCRRYDSVGYRCIAESCEESNWTAACTYTGPRFTLQAQTPPPCHPSTSQSSTFKSGLNTAHLLHP